MAKVKVLDKNLKMIRPGMRCKFQEHVARVRDNTSLSVIMQSDMAVVEGITVDGDVTLKSDKPIIQYQEVDGKLTPIGHADSVIFKSKFVRRFKAFIAQNKRDGFEVFIEVIKDTP